MSDFQPNINPNKEPENISPNNNQNNSNYYIARKIIPPDEVTISAKNSGKNQGKGQKVKAFLAALGLSVLLPGCAANKNQIQQPNQMQNASPKTIQSQVTKDSSPAIHITDSNGNNSEVIYDETQTTAQKAEQAKNKEITPKIIKETIVSSLHAQEQNSVSRQPTQQVIEEYIPAEVPPKPEPVLKYAPPVYIEEPIIVPPEPEYPEPPALVKYAPPEILNQPTAAPAHEPEPIMPEIFMVKYAPPEILQEEVEFIQPQVEQMPEYNPPEIKGE